MTKTQSLIIMFLLSVLGVGTVCADGIGDETITGYSYTLHGRSGLGTLCFPNTVSFEEGSTGKLAGFRAFTVTGISNSVLTLSEIPQKTENDEFNSISANTPVIIYWPYKAGETHTVVAIGDEYTFEPKDIQATSTNLLGGTTYSEGETITGTAECKKYIMQDKCTYTGTDMTPKVAFYRCSTVDTSYKVGQFRCWLDLTGVSGAKESSFSFSIPEKNATDIRTVKTSPLWGHVWADGIYSFDGKRVDNPVPGEIYIMVMDGKAIKFTLSKSNGFAIQ